MKNIKDLTVKVTYEVGLGDLEMPKEVYKQLLRASERGDDIKMNSMKYSSAESWLSENIRERDCMEWKVEIIDLISNESNEAEA
jgi:hypothetical protein